MTKTKRPKDRPGTPFPAMADALYQQGLPGEFVAINEIPRATNWG